MTAMKPGEHGLVEVRAGDEGADEAGLLRVAVKAVSTATNILM